MTVSEWKSDAVAIRVDDARCTGRGECVESFPSAVYALLDGKAVPGRIDECIECCTCVEACPENAIGHSACR